MSSVRLLTQSKIFLTDISNLERQQEAIPGPSATAVILETAGSTQELPFIPTEAAPRNFITNSQQLPHRLTHWFQNYITYRSCDEVSDIFVCHGLRRRQVWRCVSDKNTFKSRDKPESLQGTLSHNYETSHRIANITPWGLSVRGNLKYTQSSAVSTQVHGAYSAKFTLIK
jgi:hypothetical protein